MILTMFIIFGLLACGIGYRSGYNFGQDNCPACRELNKHLQQMKRAEAKRAKAKELIREVLAEERQ